MLARGILVIHVLYDNVRVVIGGQSRTIVDSKVVPRAFTARAFDNLTETISQT